MPTLLGRPLMAVGLAVAVSCAMPVWAASSTAAAVPTYESLIARLDEMPATLEGEALYDAANARVQQARALPNPILAIESENAYGSGEYRGYGNAETTVSVNQPLELWGKRSARVDAARSQATGAGLRRDQQRWMAAGRLARVYAAAEAADRRFDLSTEALTLVEQDARAVDALVREGREAKLRGVQATSELESARASLDEARTNRDAAFARLSAIALLDQPVQAVGDSLLDRAPAATTAPSGDPLSVRIAQSEVETANRLITVEKRRALPDVSASLGRRRFESTGDDAMTFGLNLSIPLFDRNRGGISAAYAEQRAAEARLLAQQQETQAERLAAQAALEASNSRTRAADAGVTAAEEAYRLARIGFDAGRISQLELRSSRAALIAARNAAVDARVSRVVAEIDLALLEGRAPFRDTP